ncbi:MAG: tetratricopeptide (TPR) repeat protein [Marinoscillum sp.]|jgi:tetratricopeptide (TPR) repeat protein
MKYSSVFIIFVLTITVSFAQKKHKQDAFAPLDVTTLSDSETLQMETVLIDAERELIIDNQMKALTLFKEALEMSPKDAAINFKIAEILTQNGEYNQALPYAEQSMQSDPSNKYFILLAAEIYKALSDLEEATQLYSDMINAIPGTETYLYDLAIMYQYQGKNELSLDAYGRAEEYFGMNEMILREKQKIYLKNKDYESLLADWDKLILEYDNDERYIMELCQFLISQNLLAPAKERLSKLTSKNAEILLSEIAMAEGNPEEAMRLAQSTMSAKEVDVQSKMQLLSAFLTVVKTEEEIAQVLSLTDSLTAQYADMFEVQAFAGDVMYQFDRKDEALNYYLKAVKLNGSNFGIWQNILSLESEFNRFDSVIVHAERAMEYFPNQAALYYFAGTGYLINQSFKKSIQVLEQGIKFATDPNLLTIFYGQIGDSYNSLKQFDKSYNAYDEALKANPQNDHVLNNYSYFLSLRKERLDRAVEMSTKLVELHPVNPTYLDTHGWVLYVIGKYEESLIYLRKAANLQDDGTVIEHYGDVLYKLGREDEALEQWKRAAQFDDASENINKKIADKKLYE